jgi:hypothetical protein
MQWIALIALVVIALKTIASNGDWFDFLDRNARCENWWVNLQFNALFVLLCVAVFGGGAWLFLKH